MRKVIRTALVAVLISIIGTAMAQEIQVNFAKQRWIAKLEDNALAREFAKTLPNNFSLQRFLEQEYYAEIPKLSVNGVPEAEKFVPGGIYYYEPWSTFVVFFKSGEAHSLYKIGDFSNKRALVSLLKEQPERIRFSVSLIDDGH